MFKLLLLCDYTREPERRLLHGLSDFARTKGGWTFFTAPPAIYQGKSSDAEIIKRARMVRADAIFGRWEGVTADIIRSLGIPVIVRTVDKDIPALPMLSGKYSEIGRVGGRFFLKQHYNNCAFFGYTGLIWSSERLRGFSEILHSGGVNVSTFTTSLHEPNDEALAEWLKSLPKPVGVMAGNDVLAMKIAEMCLELGIQIPEELALLGVDDDEFLCNIAFPSISSVRLDFEKQGWELGETIYKMSEDGRTWPARIKVEPRGITERNSTLRHNIQDPFIRRIVEQIDTSYDTPITLEEILRDIPLSRRAVEMRFKKEMEPETMLSYLTSLRVNKMRKLLETTQLPVSEIAERSGFDDVLNVGRVFKRYTGITPRDYRNSALAGAANYPDSSDEQNRSDNLLKID